MKNKLTRVTMVVAMTLLFLSIINYVQQEPVAVTVDIPVEPGYVRTVDGPITEEPVVDGVVPELAPPTEHDLGRAEAEAQATAEMIDDLVELIGGEAGPRWVSCEESRCAAFMAVEGVSLRDAGDAWRELQRRGSLPFALAFEDPVLGRVTYSFGDWDIARREFQADHKARAVSLMMASGIVEERAWDAVDEPIETIRLDSIEEMNDETSVGPGGAQD